jgi:hypothetical protein
VGIVYVRVTRRGEGAIDVAGLRTALEARVDGEVRLDAGRASTWPNSSPLRCRVEASR